MFGGLGTFAELEELEEEFEEKLDDFAEEVAKGLQDGDLVLDKLVARLASDSIPSLRASTNIPGSSWSGASALPSRCCITGTRCES